METLQEDHLVPHVLENLKICKTFMMGCFKSTLGPNKCLVTFEADGRFWVSSNFKKLERKVFCSHGAEYIGMFDSCSTFSARVYHTYKNLLMVLELDDVSRKLKRREHFPNLDSNVQRSFSYEIRRPGIYKILVQMYAGKKKVMDASCCFQVLR